MRCLTEVATRADATASMSVERMVAVGEIVMLWWWVIEAVLEEGVS